MTKRVNALGIIMLKERLTPPPKEAYSLHHKLSGAFLTCIKLRASIHCRWYRLLLRLCTRFVTKLLPETCCFRLSRTASCPGADASFLPSRLCNWRSHAAVELY